MKYLRLALGALLLSCSATICRSQDVIYSPYDKFDYSNGEYAVVGMTGDYLYNYRNSPEGAMLEGFDDSMKKVRTVNLDFFPGKIYQSRFISYPDKIIALYQALQGNKVIQYAALLDENALLKGKPIELGVVKTGIFGAMREYFYSAISENKKKILIYTVSEKGQSIEFDGRWLDDSLKLIKRSHASFSADYNLIHGEVSIANDGTIYMAAYAPIGTQNYADQFWMLSLGQGETKFSPHSMKLDDKFAASGYSKIDNVNNKVYFGGFYSNKKNGNFDGVIYASYDISRGDYNAIRFLPFDPVLAEAAGVKRRNHVFDNFQVQQVIVRNDGGFVLVSEAQFITTRSNYAPAMGYYSTIYSPYNTTMVREYHYNDIMALCYDKEGAKQWSAFIPKEQYSQEDNGIFSSYLLLNSGGSLAFLYNDFNTLHSRIQLATLDPDGKQKINSFNAEGNDYPDWLPRSGKQVAARVLIVPCLRKKQICYAKVVF